MTITLNGDSGITAPTYGGTVASEYHVPVTAFKNRIINGAMQIDQRNAGASVTGNDSVFGVDRFICQATQSSKFTVQQNAGSVTPPVGFTNYLGVTSSSAYSLGAGDYFNIVQKIEGLNVSDLAWGTANAKTITVSFWAYSSLTGTFGGVIQNSGYNYCYPFSYSIPVANIWTQISITIAGPTSGTWLTTNGIGLRLAFSLGCGSTYAGTAGAWVATEKEGVSGATSVVGTNGATFYITGVQLEKGSTATSFDYRPYGTELALCQRYYEIGKQSVSGFTNGGVANITQECFFSASKRANPTVTVDAVDQATNVSGVSADNPYLNGFRLVGTTTAVTGNCFARGNYYATAEL